MHRILCCDQARFGISGMWQLWSRMVSQKGLQLFMKLISSNSAHLKICLLPGSLPTGKGIIFLTEGIC